MEPEFLAWLYNTGGTSGVILLGMWKMWNGTSKRIRNTETIVTGIDNRLVRVETILEVKKED